MTPYVLLLGDPRATDPALVGPKAAHLSALARSHPVPPGFCLTAEAYRRAERAGGIDPHLSRDIVDAYARLVGDASPPPPVAVRSSALDEDGPAASFAGQHETILGVVGLDAVLEAIERTWASLRSEVALAYRRDHGLPEDGLALAVLVQRLVVADASGVAFSADPVSGRRDRMIVNATWGLGESLVAGHVTPDGWTLAKTDLHVVETRPSEKGKMTVLAGDRTVELAVPTFLRERPALSDAELAAVAKLTCDLETLQGWPVDVEFAVADGELHLLQCRPVTALPDDTTADEALGELPAPWVEAEDPTRAWRRDRMHVPGQITPLDFELMRLAVEEGITHGARHYGIPVASLSRRFWTYYYECNLTPDLPPSEALEVKASGEAAYRAVMADFEGTWRTRWRPELEGHLAFWDTFDLAAASDAGLLAHLDETHARLARLWRLHFELGIPLLRARGQFLPFYRELFPDADELDAVDLLQGQDSLTTRAGAALWDVRDTVASVPGLPERLRALPPEGVAAALRTWPEAAVAAAAFDAYLHEHGRRTLYLALTAPSLAEDPTPVAAMLQDALAHPDGDPRRRHPQVVADRERRVAETRARLAGYPAPVRREFDAQLAKAQFAAKLDEDHAYLLDYGGSAAVRRVVLEVGRRLVASGALAAADDVFLLSWAELRAALAGGGDLTSLIGARRDEMRRFADADPPEHVGAPPDAAASAGNDLAGRPPAETREPDVVTGNAGSRGRARGRARILRDLNDAGALRPGEVLVATTTSQPWTPLFGIAAGLVTDAGGVLSHTAVVAREYGLPAVVGTRIATRRFRDGMLLEVDGDRGTVRIVSEA